MESLELTTAKLVLGYLRIQKCKTAYKEFLKTSPNFRNVDYGGIKYMPTRFLGHALEEIIVEYFEMHQIIQGRLEATNYYNECHSKSVLSAQLMYLLNKVPSSRASTPITSMHGSQVDCMSPIHTDVEATRVETLPGNTENEETFVSSPARKKISSGSNRSSPSTSPNYKRAADIIDTAVLAQNLMDNTEFQEKIAQTINKVVEKQKKTKETDELDKTIKSAVEVAEADPLFDELLREILETSTNNMGSTKVSEQTNLATSAKKKDMTDTSEDENAKVTKERVVPEQPVVRPTNSLINGPDNLHIVTEPVVPFENPLSNYIIQSNTSVASVTPCIANPVYINNVPGLLIPKIPSTVSTSNSLVVISNATVPPVLTEPDIMQMPIIISDNKIEKVPDNEVPSDNKSENKQQLRILGVMKPRKPKKPKPRPVKVEVREETPIVLGPKKPKVLLPKTYQEKMAPEGMCVKDFFQNFDPSDNVCQPEASTSMPTLQENGGRPGLKRVMLPSASKTSSKPPEKSVETPKENVESTKETNVDQTSNSEKNSVPVVNKIDSTDEKIITPKPREVTKKATPKSGSHVRNLDFSTPPKFNTATKSKTPTKPMSSQKKLAAKDLFKTEDAEIDTWDAALRATVPEKFDKSPIKRRGRKKGRKSRIRLNNSITEEEGLQLEAAIKTPVKKVDENDLEEENDKNKSEASDLPEDENDFNPQVKTILSPSKINNTTKNILETSKTDVSKFITPENNKPNAPFPIKANRNIMPMLETPVKVQLPKTPGVSTPSDINFSVMNSTVTPFTKMLEANLDIKGLDIGSIPTPSPITPGFPPFTPNMEFTSPYSNRPTDYSTGSSYYQPSDNEQNKNLEAQLREMEKAPTQEASKPVDHLQMFNKHIIGKKNLNLMKKPVESDSSYDSSDGEHEAEQDISSESDKETDDTVVFKKVVVSPTNRYSLRSRGAADKSLTPKKTKATQTPVKKEKKTASKVKKCVDARQELEIGKNADDTKSILQDSKANTFINTSLKTMKTSQSSVLKELETKRQRIKESLKPKAEVPKVKKTAVPFKIKPIAKVFTSKSQRKSDSPRKKKKMTELQTLLNDLATSDDSDFHLELSDDEKETSKENISGSVDKVDNTASDVEAQNLIDGLKERGIHLMQNKSPKKKNIDGEEKDVINSSAKHLDTIDRDSFDVSKSESLTVMYMLHDEKYTPKINASVPHEDHKIEYIGQLYLESIGSEVIIHLKQTELFTLLDIEPKQISTNSFTPETADKSDTRTHLDQEERKDEKEAKNTANKDKAVIGCKNEQLNPTKTGETVHTEEGALVKSKETVTKKKSNEKGPKMKESDKTETMTKKKSNEKGPKLKETDKTDMNESVEGKVIQLPACSQEVISVERNDVEQKKDTEMPSGSKAKEKSRLKIIEQSDVQIVENVMQQMHESIQELISVERKDVAEKKIVQKKDTEMPSGSKAKEKKKLKIIEKSDVQIVENVMQHIHESTHDIISVERKDAVEKKIVQKDNAEKTSNSKAKEKMKLKDTQICESKSDGQKNVQMETTKLVEVAQRKTSKPSTGKPSKSTVDKKSVDLKLNVECSTAISVKRKKEFVEESPENVKEVTKRRRSIETKEKVEVTHSKKSKQVIKSKEDSLDLFEEIHDNTIVEKNTKKISEITNTKTPQKSKENTDTTETTKRKQKSKPDKPSVKTKSGTETEIEDSGVTTDKKSNLKADVHLKKLDSPETNSSIRIHQEAVCSTPRTNQSRKDSVCDKTVDDDLMNFAATGRDKEETLITESSSKKRKLCNEDLTENPHKRLQSVNIDNFLNQIHYS